MSVSHILGVKGRNVVTGTAKETVQSIAQNPCFKWRPPTDIYCFSASDNGINNSSGADSSSAVAAAGWLTGMLPAGRRFL